MILALIAAACLLDVDTGNAFHMAILPDARVALMLRNASPSNETVRGCLKIRDFFGHGFDLPVDAQIPAGGLARLPVPAASCRRTRSLKRLRREGDETVYEASFSPVVTKIPFHVFVHDDDGEGEDGWAELGPIAVGF